VICDQCDKNEAVVHLTQIENNEMTVVHLCDACAAERGLDTGNEPAGLPLTDFLAQMSADSGSVTPEPNERCGFCGLSFADFRETGRLGCPQCWSTFAQHLKGLTKRIHGDSVHHGKVYLPPDPTASERERRLNAMREQLDRAVTAEDFERAAELRDEIRSLEQGTVL